MTYTDTQLRRTLVKMLPDHIREDFGTEGDDFHLEWKTGRKCMRVLDAELLHLCWLVEESLNATEYSAYHSEFWNVSTRQTHSATWQQRTIALAKVKGVAIE